MVLQVNGTLVTHSNHIEVVKLIKCKLFFLFSFKIHCWILNPKSNLTLYFFFSVLAGSYVALTVLGRPPGLTQIPLSEAESEMLGVSISSPNSPATERPYSPQDRFSAQPSWVLHTSQYLVPYIYSIIQCVFFPSLVIMFHSSFTLHVCIRILKIGSFPPFIFFLFVFNRRMRTTVSATRKLTTRQKCSPESSRTCRLVEL